MKRYITLITTILCSLFLGLGDASAKGQGKGKGKGLSKGKGKPASSSNGKFDKRLSKGKSPSQDKGLSKGKGQGYEKKYKEEKYKEEKDKNWRKEAKFREKDRSDLLSFWNQYKGNTRGLPPGLAKNLRRGKPLPPGWQKKVNSGSIIDNDLWNLLDRVPGEYLPRGFRQPRGTGLFLLGDRLVRMHESRREVIDTVRIPTIRH